MFLSPFLHIISLWLCCTTAALAANSTGLTDVVQWDEYSLIVKNERVFVVSGEFHYQRLPVPELWLDVFQKIKANGMNAISIYFFWSYHSPSPDVYDLETGGKNIQKVLDYAKEAGLYVLTRPGPYCNAETNAGGIALWGSDGSAGKLRTSDETYHQAWLPWIKAIGAVLEKNQITNGGPVIMNQIENELQETDHSPDNTLVVYMEQIEQAWRDTGIVVPFFSNEKGMRSESWSTDFEDVGGAVNVYGLDSYPGGLSCLEPDVGFDVIRTFYQWFQNYSFTQPEFIPEYAGGWFEPWGGPFFDQCVGTYLAPEYADVFYKTLLGQRVTLFNLYMTYGGTNWGHSAAPVVFTSYDYDAPLRETREIRDKFRQMKLVGLFTRVSTGLRKTYMESNGSGNAVDTTAVYTFVLRNPDTHAGFYFADHTNSETRDTTTFAITLVTSAGNVTVPKIELQGRQSRIIVSDFAIGSSTLLYSSAEILTYGIFGKQTVVVFYLNEGETGEFAFKSSKGSVSTYVQPSGQSVVTFSNGVTVYMLEKATAYDFYAPATTTDPNVQPDEQIFAIGPYLVRSASVQGDIVSVVGDNQNDTTIEVYAGGSANTISWNGKHLSTKKTPYGSLTASLPGAQARNVKLPELQWKVADSLPEKQRSYDDSKWTTANHTTTKSPVAPLTLPVLFSSDYGYYSGIKIYRGRFNGKNPTAANITVQGGTAAGWSAWLNGEFVGGYAGNATVNANWVLLDFSKATLYSTDNVLTVVTDYHGHDETSTGPAGAENPRGILGAWLYDGNTTLNFTSWKIQGQAGGDQAYIDPMRGPLNEGGLYGERLGWHLPGFDASKWRSGSPVDGVSGAGVNWYIADVSLDIDTDLDVPLGIEFDAANGTVASVQLFVNGYQFGKYVPHIGPQTRFPIPPGIINLNGKNRIAVSLWSMSSAGAKLESVELFAYAKYTTGYDIPRDGSKLGLQPGWTKSRLQYA
ncbi:hypothetical protein NA57DRAFT_69687 [Rhizodiscina lignyota]|uniref:beta-galactosidase n=1 Tax=Rhizodiscina lignyota TaxID=1504668 RepID=A0A9P4M0M3_9PEZI|nr:hypothetical protein NA57DRAFT_69687 [Rhizodiscina lignyota]